MPSDEFFPPRPDSEPIIYAYCEPKNRELKGLLKVGYTSRTIEERMHEHYPTLKPGEKPYKVVFVEPAMRSDGTTFSDHEVHQNLVRHGKKRMRDRDGKYTEWFRCSVDDVRASYIAVRDRVDNAERRTRDFKMRPEQEAAVHKTEQYFRSLSTEGGARTPKFLWNAKMRFGKTFAAYELAKDMGFRRVLVLTFKPAVQAAWEEDLTTHMDFEGWQFISRPKAAGEPDISQQFEVADKKRPIVCFGSFQDFLGRERGTGRIKAQHEWVREEHWDLVIFDEYHFGAWNENSKSLFVQDDEDEANTSESVDTGLGKANEGNVDEGDLPIETSYYLFLSGTPFRALNSGEFIEEQIYNWTYSDEQRAKEAWPREHPGAANPYESLPRMVMMTYQMPEEIRRIARGGEFNTFEKVVADAKAKNGAQLWSGPAPGGNDHVLALKVWDTVGIKGKWVPYKSGPEAMMGTISGQSVAYVGNPADMAGRPGYKILALCRAERLPQFPDAPTFKELGYEGLDNEIMWRGFAIKKGAPEEALVWWENLNKKVAADPEWREYLTRDGIEPVDWGRDKFTEQVKTDIETATNMLRKVGMLK